MSRTNDALPQSRNHRVVFVMAVIAICVILYITNYALATVINESTTVPLKQHLSIIRSVIENLIAGAVAAVLLALTYRWIVDWIDPGDRVIEVPPSDITNRLLRNARNTRGYVFIGNTASFVSSSVLPILAESARHSGQPKLVTLFLIDPTDASAVNAYVGYRARALKGSHKVADSELAVWFPPQDKKAETPDEVIAKILATVYLAAYVALYPGMNISVCFRRSFTPFRADISDQEAVLTQESAAEAAVAFSLTASRDSLRDLHLAHPTASFSELESSLQALLHLIQHLEPLLTKPSVISKAAQLIGRPKRPY
jgi:hypothetical protein